MLYHIDSNAMKRRNKKTVTLLLAVILLIGSMFSGCGLGESVDVAFAENLPKTSPVMQEINLLNYLVAEAGVKYEMTATYTTEDGKSGEYMTYGSGSLSFKPEYLGNVEIKLHATKEGKKEVSLSAKMKITVTSPRVMSQDRRVFYKGQTVTMDELLECMQIAPRNAVETTFTKVTFNGKEVDLTGKTEYTFEETCVETTFHFTCKNEVEEIQDTYTVRVTPYRNEAEEKDLVNRVDSSKQTGMATITYEEEASPYSDGSFAYRFTADADCTWDAKEKTWKSYVFIQFPENFDMTKQYITFDAMRSEDSYKAIVYHYIVDMEQKGTVSIPMPANEWTECSTIDFMPDEKHAGTTEYTGICFSIAHTEDEDYDPENVWNLIDNIQLRNFPEVNAYEKQDLTNNIRTTTGQSGMMEFMFSDKVSTIYDDPNKKGTYSYEITADPACVWGTDKYGQSYVHISLPFDGSKVHPVFDIMRTEDCDANILVYYTIDGMKQGESKTYTESNAWNYIDTSNFRALEGCEDTNYTGIAIIFNHPEKSTSEYNEENVKIWIDNLRLEENYW